MGVKESVPRNISNKRNMNILFTVIIVFALSLVGWGISVLVGNSIPFWLLFGFSVFYSIEKWLNYYTRKYKIVGKIYRLILNLSVLSLFGLLIWSGIALFSQRFLHSPLIGSLVFLAELAIFIWFCRVVAKNSWRQPSMKLTAFSLVCLFIIFAFAGVQPLASYKDSFFDKMGSLVKTVEDTSEEAPKDTSPDTTTSTIPKAPTPITPAIEPTTSPSNPSSDEQKALSIGKQVIAIVNSIRVERGSPGLSWDDKLYEYSLAHSKNMAKEGRLFHTDMHLPYAENAWWGGGSSWGAQDIVESWMNSKMHRTWLLCPNLRHVAVGIFYSNNGMYASWTFWKNETSHSDWWYQYTPDNPPEWWY